MLLGGVGAFWMPVTFLHSEVTDFMYLSAISEWKRTTAKVEMARVFTK